MKKVWVIISTSLLLFGTLSSALACQGLIYEPETREE